MPRKKRDPLAPVHVEQRVHVPIVWIVVLSLVWAGILLHLILSYFGSSGLLIWPFLFSVCLLLLLNDASEKNGAGVPPLQAYALFFGAMLVFSIGVALISVINIWLLTALMIASGCFIFRDWKRRQRVLDEMSRRRVAGLCVRCLQPVEKDLEAMCENCGLPVNPERLTLRRLAGAIANKAQQSHTRQILAGKAPTRSQLHAQQLSQTRAYRYKRGK